MGLRETSQGRESNGYQYVGRCVRTALELGLHLSVVGSGLGSSEIEVRKVTFWGVFNLETYVHSLILVLGDEVLTSSQHMFRWIRQTVPVASCGCRYLQTTGFRSHRKPNVATLRRQQILGQYRGRTASAAYGVHRAAEQIV